jgi:hypothetical protein
MPIREFKCPNGHITERLFLTFKDDEISEDLERQGIRIQLCHTCAQTATRVEWSVPQPALLYGEGFYKPAASGRPSTRVEDPVKAAKEAVQEIGAGNLIKGVKAHK